MNRIPASRFEMAGSAADEPSELVARGGYVARLSDCVACHSVPGGAAYAGGLKMATPMGAVYTTNITPDRNTGIGSYTLADFDRALRSGVAKDGHRLYPAMPYPSYAKLSDDDVKALYAYFMRGIPAVHQQNRQSTIPWPLNMRWPLAFWNVVFAPSGVYHPDATKDTQWNRGAYIVEGAGHCGACHTPRGLAFNEKGTDSHSAAFVSGALIDGWYAPSLRNTPNTGLGRWSEDDLFRFLKTGRNEHAVVFGSMAEAFNNSTQFFSDDDLRAVAHYLKSLPGDGTREGASWHYEPTQAAAREPAKRQELPGAQTYMAKCSFCHGADGRGQGQWVPPLAGAASSMMQDSSSSINITLNGSGRVVAAGVPDAYRMPSYREQLSDTDIADVLTFIRLSWGNRQSVVFADDVKKLRDQTTPANSSPVILKTH
ncbi:cytochrome c [Acetobacter sp. LMG 32666]|uniref:c-type cytochrome n=1 Tax=Acetobacter sp. LMG 32666 TaxID=2959295 RepID=UPI0030C8B055